MFLVWCRDRAAPFTYLFFQQMCEGGRGLREKVYFLNLECEVEMRRINWDWGEKKRALKSGWTGQERRRKSMPWKCGQRKENVRTPCQTEGRLQELSKKRHRKHSGGSFPKLMLWLRVDISTFPERKSTIHIIWINNNLLKDWEKAVDHVFMIMGKVNS